MLKKCPICDGDIIITEYKCNDCDVTISGEFEIEDLGLSVNKEIMEFIKVFIYAEGNMKKVEGILNCSYPKVKSLLKKAKKSLGVDKNKENNNINQNKKKILDKLDNGEISFDEAMKRLNSK